MKKAMTVIILCAVLMLSACNFSIFDYLNNIPAAVGTPTPGNAEKQPAETATAGAPPATPLPKSGKSVEEAINVTPGSQVEGVIKSSSDHNYYVFNVETKGMFSVRMTYPVQNDSGTFWRLYLYKSDNLHDSLMEHSYDGFYPSDDNSSGIISKGSIEVGLNPGKYYVVVYGGMWGYSRDTYHLEIQQTATRCNEAEPNNNVAHATKVDINTPIKGALQTGTDIDYYEFSLNSKGVLSFNMSYACLNDSGTFWRLYLYKSDSLNDSLMEPWYDGFYPEDESTAVISKDSMQIGLNAGKYYVEVYHGTWSSSTETYTLTINFTEADNYELEPNNSTPNATAISLFTPINGGLQFGRDSDHYVFAVNDKGIYTFDMRYPRQKSDSSYWRIFLYRSDNLNNYILKYYFSGQDPNADNSSSFVTQSSKAVELNPGKYYLEIYSGDFASSTDTYTLTINRK